MFSAKIPAKEQPNVMASFWSMMVQLETQADNDGNALDKHMVESYFRQWNSLMDDDKEPAWVRRSK